MPGPPYPDPRGQNRWGVKFDPRKHGPPYDKIRGTSLKDIYEQGTRSQAPSASNSLLQLRPRRRRPFRHIEREPLRGPPRMRSRSHNRRPRRRQNRYYGNELKKKRPRPHHNSHEEEEEEERPVYPVKPEEHKLFWNKWNSWYQSQEDAKEKLKKGKSHSHQHHKEAEPTPITYYIDAEEFAKLQDPDEDGDEEEYGGNYLRGYGGRWKARRAYYMAKMREMYRKAKDLTIPDNGEEEGKSEATNTGESWRIFTAIGKGMDAANEAMGSVRKTIGGSILGTGMKYGGKMALNAMMNVGTSALTTALQSATPLG